MEDSREVMETIRDRLIEALENDSCGCGLDSVEQHAEYPSNGFAVTSGKHVFAVVVTKVK